MRRLSSHASGGTAEQGERGRRALGRAGRCRGRGRRRRSGYSLLGRASSWGSSSRRSGRGSGSTAAGSTTTSTATSTASRGTSGRARGLGGGDKGRAANGDRGDLAAYHGGAVDGLLSRGSQLGIREELIIVGPADMEECSLSVILAA